MRLDFGLYGVAIICLVIAGTFAANAVPGYSTSTPQAIAVVIIFLVLGVISGIVGYSARPKAGMPTAQSAPASTTAEASWTPITPTPEPLPRTSSEETPHPTSTSQSLAAKEKGSEIVPPEQLTPSKAEDIAVAPPKELEHAQVAEEEKPKKKRVRRRKKKT